MVRRGQARQGATGRGFIDPQALARISNLELVARTVVDGFLSGLHRSPHLGVSLDFAEHRPYMPGDDIRWVDWKLQGRTDRFYVKRFEADTNASLVLMLDVSGSMGFRTGGITKLDYARFLSASLAYFSSRQRDRVGLTTYGDGIREYVPPSAKHLDTVLHRIARSEAEGPGQLRPVVLKVAEALRRRSFVLVVSDFYEDPAEVTDAIGLLAYQGHDVVVFQVLDPAEIDFPYEEAAPFVDMESGEELPVVPETLADRYRQLMAAHLSALESGFRRHGVDYTLVRTDQPLDHALFSYLSTRERKSRVR
jgi:uncharacterized protein (DUF58 family)